MNVSTQCSCGLVTVAKVLDIHDHDDMNDAGYYAIVRWQTEDIHTYRSDQQLSPWTEEQAQEWLSDNQQRVQDRMIEVGWDTILDMMEEGE